MAPTTNLRISMISISLLLSVLLCYLCPSTKAFMLCSHPGQIGHQRSGMFWSHNLGSRRKSPLKSFNTREDMEDIVLLLPLYEAELVKLNGSGGEGTKDVERIQELKDKIENAKTAAEFGVRRVQSEFYDAFSTADYQRMSDVWSRSDDVCCTHPGMHSLQGTSAVMDSWRQIFAGYAGADDKKAFKITPSRAKVDICGQTAICTCVENTSGGKLEALNIYRREGGSWKMVNHMASPVMM